MNGILQARDRGLLNTLGKYGVLSTSQICYWFFSGVAKTTVLRRLRLLEKRNFIQRGVTLDNGTNTWSLGFKGHELTSVRSKNSFSNRNSIHHDVFFGDIRRKLERLGLAKEVVPEFELKADVFRSHRFGTAKERVVPDALMIEPSRGESWAISLELELTVKSEKRYALTFRQYATMSKIQMIWYFCNSLAEATRIMKLAKKYAPFAADKFCFSFVKNFLESQNPQLWHGSSDRMVSVAQIKFDNFRQLDGENQSATPAHGSDQGVSSLDSEKAADPQASKPVDLQPNSLNPASLREAPPVPDPSPPTKGGKGSGTGGQEDSGLSEFRDVSQLKKSG